MNRLPLTVVLVFGSVGLCAGGVGAQSRPDFSGAWRLDPAESRVIGGGGPPGEYQLTWLVNYRDPEISGRERARCSRLA